MKISPEVEYQKKIITLTKDLDVLDLRYANLSSLRMGIFFSGLTLGLINNSYKVVSSWWLLIFVLIFTILIILHEKLAKKQNDIKFKIDFFEKGIDRISGKWQEYEHSNENVTIEEHLYAHDLNLFGQKSLFVYLCLAYTQYGKQRLKSWLTSFADNNLVLKRQDAVRELEGEVDFRMSLGFLAKNIESKVNSNRLVDWSESEPLFTSEKYKQNLALTYIFTILMFISLLIWGLSSYGPYLFVAVLFCETIFTKRIKREMKPLLNNISIPSKELSFVATLLDIIETKKFTCKFLCDLQNSIVTKDEKASPKIKRLDVYIRRLDMGRNQFVAFFAFIFMWDIHFGLKIEKWRLDNSLEVKKWLEVVGEFESINSVANYSFEHPEDVFPRFSSEEVFFEAEELGHPLIGEKTCVRNSIKLNQDSKLWIVSGSNMCGKSTFLRVIGINLVMTYIGAPVRAKNMELSELTLATSINVQDSLEKGHSKFYSEIVRLQELLEYSSEETPMLFLLDELLHGTNSHDRLIGAKAIISHLLEQGAIGLVTTHDLSLTNAVEELNFSATNVHFRDEFKDGKIHFDYKHHKGVVQSSNAIELMRSIGIKV